MSRLILLNGPPACGKSTLARMYVEHHPLALNLDIDKVRDLIGGWRDNTVYAYLLAQSVALTAARTHLASHHDVIIPHCGRLAFIKYAERLADKIGVDFREIFLLDTKENALRRFRERRRINNDPTHHWLGLPEVAEMYDLLMSVIAARPATKIVHTEHGKVEQAYQELLACLTQAPDDMAASSRRAAPETIAAENASLDRRTGRWRDNRPSRYVDYSVDQPDR